MELRAGLVTATHAYLPVQASQFDIWTLDHLEELVALAQGFNPTLRAFVVLTRVSPNPLVAEVAEAKALTVPEMTSLFKDHVNPGQLHFMKLLGFHKVKIESAQGMHYTDQNGRKPTGFVQCTGSSRLSLA